MISKCSRCGEVREHNTRNGKKQSYCITCTREYSRNHHAASKDTQHNKDRRKRNRQSKNERNREFIMKAKDVPCTDCGNRYPYYVMDFDHLDPALKKANLGEVSRRWSLQRLQEEIDKCEVVCANCHRVRTFNRA